MTNFHRYFLAIIWGIVFTAIGEKTQIGKYILEKINWLAVLVGVAGCWVIASPLDGGNAADQAKQKQHNIHFFVLGWAAIPIIFFWAWVERNRVDGFFRSRWLDGELIGMGDE